jgi:hypothetical protein
MRHFSGCHLGFFQLPPSHWSPCQCYPLSTEPSGSQPCGAPHSGSFLRTPWTLTHVLLRKATPLTCGRWEWGKFSSFLPSGWTVLGHSSSWSFWEYGSMMVRDRRQAESSLGITPFPFPSLLPSCSPFPSHLSKVVVLLQGTQAKMDSRAMPL